MGILECASEASVWRGYHYYKERRVVYMEEIRAHVYAAAVQGTQKEPYAVKMDLDHPEESTCSCPYAMNMQVVCKHIVATYFAVFPEAAEALERAADEDYDVDDEDYDDDYDEDYDEDCDEDYDEDCDEDYDEDCDDEDYDEDCDEDYDEDCDEDYDEDCDDEALSEGMYRAVLRRVLSMEQMELQHTLLQLLFNGPSRQLARFIRENGLEDEG